MKVICEFADGVRVLAEVPEGHFRWTFARHKNPISRRALDTFIDVTSFECVDTRVEVCDPKLWPEALPLWRET